MSPPLPFLRSSSANRFRWDSAMEGVQNLRRAVYDFKLRAEAADVGSKKSTKIFAVALNYLYRRDAHFLSSLRF